MSPTRQVDKESKTGMSHALLSLVSLLARQTARDFLISSLPSSSPASSPANSEPIPSPNYEGGGHEH